MRKIEQVWIPELQASLPATVQLLMQPLVSHRMNSSSRGRSVPNSTCSSLMCKELYRTNSLFRRSTMTTVPSYAPSSPVKLWWQEITYRQRNGFQEWLKAAQVQPRVSIHNGKIIVRHIDQLLPSNSRNEQVQPDDRFTFFNEEHTSTTPPTEDQQDEIPAPRYNLRWAQERRPVDRLMKLSGEECDVLNIAMFRM